jgi:hypothetical protein
MINSERYNKAIKKIEKLDIFNDIIYTSGDLDYLTTYGMNTLFVVSDQKIRFKDSIPYETIKIIGVTSHNLIEVVKVMSYHFRDYNPVIDYNSNRVVKSITGEEQDLNTNYFSLTFDMNVSMSNCINLCEC